MSYYSLQNEEKPNLDKSVEVWSYAELKKYFHDLVASGDVNLATRSFLSNVEGLGDYFDKHKFFDFQAYLILNLYWFENHNKVLNFLTLEYKYFAQNIKMLLDGKFDDWTTSGDLASMKADANKLTKLYYVEE